MLCVDNLVNLLLNGRQIIVIRLLPLLMAVALLLRLMMLVELSGGRADLRAGVVRAMMLLMMYARQVVQRCEFLRFLDNVEELRVALCHFLRHHLLSGLGESAKAQKVVQLRLRRMLLLLLLQLAMTMLGMVLIMEVMIMEDATVVHAGAIARDHRVILDDAIAAAVRQ